MLELPFPNPGNCLEFIPVLSTKLEEIGSSVKLISRNQDQERGKRQILMLQLELRVEGQSIMQKIQNFVKILVNLNKIFNNYENIMYFVDF